MKAECSLTLSRGFNSVLNFREPSALLQTPRIQPKIYLKPGDLQQGVWGVFGVQVLQ